MFAKVLFTVLQILSALILITLVISQTTKSEGLTGTIGGKASSSFRGKPGIDDKLATLTTYSAITFMVASILVYVVNSRPAG
jgi:preprotein translocase subunit SecG